MRYVASVLRYLLMCIPWCQCDVDMSGDVCDIVKVGKSSKKIIDFWFKNVDAFKISEEKLHQTLNDKRTQPLLLLFM